MNKIQLLFLIIVSYFVLAQPNMTVQDVSKLHTNDYTIENATEHHKDVKKQKHEVALNLFENEEEEEENRLEEEINSGKVSFEHMYNNFISHSGILYLWDYNNSQNFYTYFDSSHEFQKLYVVKETISLLI